MKIRFEANDNHCYFFDYSTGKSIIVYNTKVNAWIFPRKDMGELTTKVI